MTLAGGKWQVKVLPPPTVLIISSSASWFGERNPYLRMPIDLAEEWENLSVYFKYPADIRRVIYTTNAIEAVHRQFRKLTKTRGAFPNENSLLKLLYMGIQNASSKWTMPIHNWNLIVSRLSIYFEGRLDGVLDI